MRERNKSVHIRLTPQEYDDLCRQSQKAGLSKSTFLRFLMKGLVPQDKPAPEFWQVRQELFRIGNNLNQLAAAAHARGWLHAQYLDEALAELNKTNMELLNRQLPQEAGTEALLERGRKAEEEVE